jgi:hypothetical protein
VDTLRGIRHGLTNAVINWRFLPLFPGEDQHPRPGREPLRIRQIGHRTKSDSLVDRLYMRRLLTDRSRCFWHMSCALGAPRRTFAGRTFAECLQVGIPRHHRLPDRARKCW